MKEVDGEEKNNKLLVSAFITGTVLVLTIGIIFRVYLWIWGYVYEFISPIESILKNFVIADKIIIIILSFIILVSISLVMGLFIHTIARNKYEVIFEKTLYKLPLFKTIKEAIHQIVSKENGNNFERKCLAKIYSEHAESLGYIVDEYDNKYVVYIPTAPVISSGMIFILDKSYVLEIDVEGSEILRVILSCGIGTGKMVDKVNRRNQI